MSSLMRLATRQDASRLTVVAHMIRSNSTAASSSSSATPSSPSLPASPANSPSSPRDTRPRNPAATNTSSPHSNSIISFLTPRQSLQSSQLLPDMVPLDPPPLPPTDRDRDWWHLLSSTSSPRGATPGNQYSGRSISRSKRVSDFTGMYRIMSGVITRSGLRKEQRLGEFREKPSDKRQRVESERHRRRFQDMVRRKVQTVQAIRNRG